MKKNDEDKKTFEVEFLTAEEEQVYKEVKEALEKVNKSLDSIESTQMKFNAFLKEATKKK